MAGTETGALIGAVLPAPSPVSAAGASSPVDLARTLAWRTATGSSRRMLEELQANILIGHVREHMSILLFRFDDRSAGRSFLRWIAPLVKSALTQLQERDHFGTTGTSITAPYVGLGLTSDGYRAIGVDTTPHDPLFAAGMAAGIAQLGDPSAHTWDAPYCDTVHAAVLIGDRTAASVASVRARVLGLHLKDVVLVGEEIGLGQHNAAGRGIEHFGYVDGRSQPLFLDEDIAAERHEVWDPSAPLGSVLVSDPAVDQPDEDPASFGSYLVLRKLEQNVRAFMEAEAALARQLDPAHPDPALAGAMVVGRFRDGTPVVLQSAPGLLPDPETNDFGYDDDLTGAKCPLHSHVRKSNPRGTGGTESRTGERRHLMARRGQAYGVREDDPSDPSVPIEQRPTGGVGLLFMAMNASPSQQFAFVQQRWVNLPDFPDRGGPHPPGLDDVIGQGERRPQEYGVPWGKAAGAPNGGPFVQTVTMRGGAYFFLPSRTFLRSV